MTNTYDHITVVLQKIHWLPEVRQTHSPGMMFINNDQMARKLRKDK